MGRAVLVLMTAEVRMPLKKKEGSIKGGKASVHPAYTRNLQTKSRKIFSVSICSYRLSNHFPIFFHLMSNFYV